MLTRPFAPALSSEIVQAIKTSMVLWRHIIWRRNFDEMLVGRNPSAKPPSLEIGADPSLTLPACPGSGVPVNNVDFHLTFVVDRTIFDRPQRYL